MESLTQRGRTPTEELMLKIRKIHISGGPGSGKTYIARIFAKKMKLELFSLDDIYWNPIHNDYSTPFSDEERINNLSKIFRNQHWITEGTYTEPWINEVLSKVDSIIILDINPYVRALRIIKRFILNKLQKAGRSESIANLYHMLKWNFHYQKCIFEEIKNISKEHQSKVLILTQNYNYDQIIDLLLKKASPRDL